MVPIIATVLGIGVAGCGGGSGLASAGAVSPEQFKAVDKRDATPESVIGELGKPLNDETLGTGSARLRCLGYQRQDRPTGAYSFCFAPSQKLVSKDAG